jgi:hypothetical protein
MSMTTAKYYFLGAVILVIGLSLSIGMAESAERFSATSPVTKNG